MNTEDSEFERIEREQARRAVPDAIHHTDTSEPLEYIQGWNDCRQAMLAEQPAQRKPLTEAAASELIQQDSRMEDEWTAALALIRRTEAAHGIKENT